MSPDNLRPLLPTSGKDHQIYQTKDRELSRSVTNFAKEECVESKKLWQIAVPSIFCRLAMFSLTVITQSFAGHLGQRQLAAISIVTTVIISITFGFLCSRNVVWTSIRRKELPHVGCIFATLMGCIVSMLFLLPLFTFAEPILKLMGQPTELAELTGQVAIWLIPMHISFVFQFTLTRFLQCQLKTYVVAWVSGGVLVVHVVLSWIFIYKMRVGIVGTALILNFSWWMSVFGMLIYVVCGGCCHSWTGFSRQAFVGLWDFFKLSLASGIMLSLENFYYRMLIIVSGYMKNAEVAVDALSICVTLYGWESMIPLGLFAATGIRVANEIGAGNGHGAIFAAKVSVLNSLVIGFIVLSIVIAFPDKIAVIFTSSLPVILMVERLALLAITILFNCIQPILSGVAVGSGWQDLVAYINLGSYYLVGVPLGIILGCFLHIGFEGIWGGMIIGT